MLQFVQPCCPAWIVNACLVGLCFLRIVPVSLCVADFHVFPTFTLRPRDAQAILEAHAELEAATQTDDIQQVQSALATAQGFDASFAS